MSEEIHPAIARFRSSRHELSNSLSIALANVEAMADGTFEVTPQRLNNVCEALRAARIALADLAEDDAAGSGSHDPGIDR
ncbi:MAG: hypothetical protein ABI231_05090 [Candidatus Tumulicola sp.]